MLNIDTLSKDTASTWSNIRLVVQFHEIFGKNNNFMKSEKNPASTVSSIILQLNILLFPQQVDKLQVDLKRQETDHENQIETINNVHAAVVSKKNEDFLKKNLVSRFFSSI